MIISRIEVQAFRRFVEPFAVELDPTKVNVVHGPNGHGKSTLLEAMRFAFLRSHKATGGDVAEVAPWGRHLGPRVSVEFEAGGKRLRAEKQYLHAPQARLSEWRSGRFEAVSEGPRAEEMLRQFVGMRPGFDKGGRGKEEFWTSVLWSTQGGLELAAVDGSVLEQARGVLGAQMESGVARRVVAEVERFAGENWPPVERNYKKNSPVLAMEAQLGVLSNQIEACRAELASMDELRGEIAGLGALLDQLSAEHGERRREREGLGADLARLHALDHQIELETKSTEHAAGEEQAARQEFERRHAAEQRLTELAAQLEQAAARRVRAGEWPVARSRKDSVTEMWRQAVAYTQSRRERDRIAGRVRSAEEAAARVKAIDEVLETLQAPTRAELDALASLKARLEMLEARLESALIHVEVRAERDLELEVEEGEPSGHRRVAAGQSLTVSGSPAVRVRVEGMGEWRSTGPATSAAEIREELEKARTEWGETDLDDLRRRREQADGLERERLERSAAAQDYVVLASDLDLRSRECAALEGRYAGWREQAPDPEAIALELREAENAEAEAREAESEWKRLSETDAHIRSDSVKMQPLEELQQKLNAAALQVRRLELNLADLIKQRHGLPAGLAERGAQIESEIARLNREIEQARQKKAGREGALAEKAGRTPYATLTQAEEEAAEIRSKYERETLRAEAALLLRTTLSETKREMLEDYAGEIGAVATTLLEEITLRRLGEVKLNAELTPWGVRPEPLDAKVALEQLSGGESEQVHFATRLALADILCRDEPGLVVFDDALMATDDQRLRRILAMLEARTSRMQVLILTCHPERYAPLRDANLISLA